MSERKIPPSPAVATIRWGVVVLGLLFAAVTSANRLTFVYGSILLAYTLWRTARPMSRDVANAVVAVINEVALTVVVIALTGWYESPFLMTLLAPVAAAMYVRGAVRAIEARQSLALDQLARLTETNLLLSELQDVTRALPTSLDLRDTVASVVAQLREMFDPNVIAVLLHDDVADHWAVAAATGVRLPRIMATGDLPPMVAAALTAPGATFIEHGPGLGTASTTGLYVALRARGHDVGLLAIERIVPGTLTERHRALLDAFVDRAALAIDNARIFGRLRRLGADEERSRIARDLHDRVGQGLAYLSFELDRISRHASEGVRHDIATLRADVRQILGDVRETLSDIRTDVSENQDFVGTVDAFITRVSRRSDLRFDFEHESSQRLPLPIEREMWRIAQEALANAERHSGASLVHVRWRCADHRALLEVVDDGAGMATTTPSKPGSFGLIGMRERADAIGAALEIDSEVGRGTTVRCTLETQ